VTATATTTASARLTACSDTSIRSSLGKQGAAGGNNFTVVLFQNTSGQVCYLRGYPGAAKRSTEGSFGATPLRRVLIAPHGFASAMVDGSDTPSGKHRSCPTYTSLRVTPPNLYRTVTLAVKIPACARLSVEPVTTGKRGSPQQ
jgi:hypothetical protein